MDSAAPFPLPPLRAPLPVREVEVCTQLLADGTRLDADVYRPDAPGDYPMLLQRQAYGRRIGCTLCYAHPAWYAAQGYVVVVQDVRGRGSSTGVFHPGLHEAADGAAAVEWAARLPGANGRVGSFGFSYQAYNQLLAATGNCPSLVAMVPAMGPWDAARHWMFENGALRLKQAVGWGVQITAEGARRVGDAAAYAELAAAGLPVEGPVSARPDVLMRHAGLSHFAEWIGRGADDPAWAAISPAAQAQALAARALPTLLIGGWFDTHLASTLAAARALAGPATRLLVGPWAHFPWGRKTGQIDFGPAAALDTDRLQIAWFNRWLKEEDNGIDALPPLRLFDMGQPAGQTRWRDFATMPPATVPLFTSGDGHAAIRPEAGQLQPQPPAPMAERLVHDPWRPAPAVGGSHGTPPGPVDRAGVESRGDVLTFTSPAADKAWLLAGEIAAALTLGADQPGFDVACTLSRVDGQGRSFQLAAGYMRVPAGAGLREIRLPLGATCATLQAGEALRLSIAGAAFPAFPVNPGSGADPAATPRAEARIITLTLHCGGAAPSLLLLPETAA